MITNPDDCKHTAEPAYLLHLREARTLLDRYRDGEATAHATIAQAIATERVATALEGLLLVLDTRGEVSGYLHR